MTPLRFAILAIINECGAANSRELRLRLDLIGFRRSWARPLDIGALYRLLQDLETEQLVTSRVSYEPPEPGGHLIRHYQLTDKGRWWLEQVCGPADQPKGPA